MAVGALIGAKILVGTTWTGTAPGINNPTPSGTITTSTDLSAWGKTLATPFKIEMPDATTFAAGGYKQAVPGLKSIEAVVTLFQDFAASAVYATLAALQTAQPPTLTYWDINPTTSARSATNPSLVFAAYIDTFDFLSASVGDVAEVPVGLTVTGKPAYLIS